MIELAPATQPRTLLNFTCQFSFLIFFVFNLRFASVIYYAWVRPRILHYMLFWIYYRISPLPCP